MRTPGPRSRRDCRRPFLLLALEQRHGAEATVGADAHDGAAALTHGHELLDRLRQDARAGRTEGMAERNRAAVRIDPVHRQLARVEIHARLVATEFRALERGDVAQHLRGEGLVDLPQRDVGIAQLVAREQARNRVRRRHQQALVEDVDRRDLEVEQARARRRSGQALDACARCDPKARRAVGQGRGVARRDRALAALPVERRLKLRELLEAGVGAREAVALRLADGNDQIIEEAGFLPRDRFLVAGERDLVLRLAAYAPGLGHLLAVLAHALAGRAVLDLEYVEVDVPRLQRAQRGDPLRRGARLADLAQPVRESLRQPDLHATHGLDAADERELPAAAPEYSRGLERRHHAGRAGENRGESRDGLVEAGFDLDLARDVRVMQVGNDRTPHEKVGP